MYLLFFIWITFIFLVGISEMETEDYIIFSLTMLYINYIYNQIIPVKLSIRYSAIFLIPPSLIMMHILYTTNWLLLWEPYDEALVIMSFFIYGYFLIYFICEFD